MVVLAFDIPKNTLKLQDLSEHFERKEIIFTWHDERVTNIADVLIILSQ